MLGQVLPSLVAPSGFNWQISITRSTVAAQLTPVIAAGWPRATAFSLLTWYVFAPQCTCVNRYGFCPVKPPSASTVTESAVLGSRRENPVPASATLRQQDLGNAERNTPPRQRERRAFVPRQAMDRGKRVG